MDNILDIMRANVEENDEDAMQDELSNEELSDEDSDYVEEAEESEDLLSEASDSSSEDEEERDIDALVSKDGTRWERNVPNPAGRRAAPANIVREQQGHTRQANQIQTMKDALELFITDDIIDQILRHSNRKGLELTRAYNGNLGPGQEAKEWRNITPTELKGYIGLVILAGVFKSGHEHTIELWSLKGRPIFRAAMTRNRFTEITKVLRFDDSRTRAQRLENDKLAAFRDIWEMFLARLPMMYKPGFDITVDEQLAAFRGNCRFRQYIPTKPGKYGIKIFWATDARSSYPLKGEVYLGRNEGNERAVDVGQSVVKRLVSPWYRSRRNVTMDNFFTDTGLAQDLLVQNMTLVGTVRKNKRFVPKEMLPNRNREVESSIFGFQDHMSLVSYVPKRSKAVVLLSSMHHDDVVNPEHKNKPDIVLHYNDTKSGVDNLDHLVRFYSCKRGTRRWPMVLFPNMIDVAGVAAFVVWISRFPDWQAPKTEKRRLFLIDLGYSLIDPMIQERMQNPRTVQKGAKIALKSLGYVLVAQRPGVHQANTKGRCHICERAVDRKVKQKCGECDQFICNEHAQLICHSCQDEGAE